MGKSKINISSIENALKILLKEFYPYIDSFSDDLYSLDDVVKQIIFEIIKEEYKNYAATYTCSG